MSDYRQDPNDTQKQIPGVKPEKYYGRHSVQPPHSMSKTPNEVYVNLTPTMPVGFFFGSSASYAEKVAAAGGNEQVLTSSADFVNYGMPTTGTTLKINPSAWSGSAADASSLTFIYRGGLDGSGRP